jgi:hypothetical protein
MGADYVIASNVSHGLKPHQQLNNAIQVLMQIAFFKDGEDNKRQINLSNFYISQPLDGYSSGSFDKSEEILDAGIKAGNQYYPAFKHLADSLSAIYGQRYFVLRFPSEKILYCWFPVRQRVCHRFHNHLSVTLFVFRAGNTTRRSNCRIWFGLPTEQGTSATYVTGWNRQTLLVTVQFLKLRKTLPSTANWGCITIPSPG